MFFNFNNFFLDVCERRENFVFYVQRVGYDECTSIELCRCCEKKYVARFAILGFVFLFINSLVLSSRILNNV